MSSIEKIVHWLVVISLFVLVLTAISANVLFSKEAIMESFAFSLPAVGVEIAPSDQLFMARIERRFTWEIHFWTGAVLMALALFRFFYFVRRERKSRWMHWVSFLLVGGLFLSGLPLFLRIYMDFPLVLQQNARELHALLAWGMGGFVIGHIAWVIYLENSQKRAVFSNMFTFKGKFFLLALLFLPSIVDLYAKGWESDVDYRRGMAYMEGRAGVKISAKTIQNCPYAKCDEVADRVDGNSKTITIKSKNYPKMVAHFRKSLKRGNPLAAQKLAKFLLGRIDYRSDMPNKQLVTIGERETGMAYKEYLALAQEALQLAADAKDCYSMFKLAEIKEHGHMGFAKDPQGARRYYEEILQRCDRKSFFYMVSQKRVD